MSNTITQADLSAQNWQAEATAAAEAYTEEQADEAARQRDAQRAREEAAAAGGSGAGDGVDPPPGNDSGGGPDPMFGGGQPPPGRPGQTGGTAGSGPKPPPPGAVKLSQDEVAAERAKGNTVTSVGNGQYVINAPNSTATDVSIIDDTPRDPDPTTWLPGSNTPNTTTVPTNQPPAGPPDVVSGAGVPVAPDENREPVTTGMGKEVDDIVNKSPTLQKHLRELQEQGWKVVFGKAGVGGVGTDEHGNPVIFIDPSLKGQPKNIAAVISHEVGHVRSPVAPVSPNGLSMGQYSDRKVDSYLDNEGAAVLENLEAHREGGLEIAGFQPDRRYEQVYSDYKSGRISEQEAIHQLGQIYGDGELHGGSRVTYRDHYTQVAQQEWTDAQARP